MALFGATMGQGVVWYTDKFYALFYLQKIFAVDLVAFNLIIGAALLVGTPLFVYFLEMIGESLAARDLQRCWNFRHQK